MLIQSLLLSLLPSIAHLSGQGQDLDHKMGIPVKNISLVLSQDDDERVLRDLMFYWESLPTCPFPKIIAMEPGPIDLIHGMRVLANEIPPRLTVPDLLIISSMGDLRISDPFLAFVRRCLQEKVTIWVVGDHFPEVLAELPLTPGQRIERIGLEDMGPRLQGL